MFDTTIPFACVLCVGIVNCATIAVGGEVRLISSTAITSSLLVGLNSVAVVVTLTGTTSSSGLAAFSSVVAGAIPPSLVILPSALLDSATDGFVPSPTPAPSLSRPPIHFMSRCSYA
ncbi:hypothetical protein PF011_g11657 [Phytophthora fragariae]|uniref:Uncharacterized protein n=1 Tax=Phytophthora fragariae TaxID=53985 RepID=A0A6A3KFX7_9STRA|nr:hypothetical protein PF011_g11657 [Phytophthora fragariae]